MATEKQKMAFGKIVENHGNISKTMKEVGYSENSAVNPKNLTESKGWKELMEEHLPDRLLAEKHNELLNVPKKVRHFKKGELESEYEELDSQAISKGLDMAYKLKSKYTPEKVESTVKIKDEPDDLLVEKLLNAYEINRSRKDSNA
jgi:hypothetical protein